MSSTPNSRTSGPLRPGVHGSQLQMPKPIQTLITGCAVCHSTTNPSRCAGCEIIHYCSRDHQASDRPSHKSSCTKIKKAKAVLDSEDEKLRAMSGDFMTPANPLENEDAIGHFWSIQETRPYMRARFGYVEALLKVKSRSAVEKALEHLLDMLRLCRGDNMGVREDSGAVSAIGEGSGMLWYVDLHIDSP